MVVFEVAYCQMAGAGKERCQDALFNGAEVKQVNLHKARRIAIEPNAEGKLRLAVADGAYHSPEPHLASYFWMDAFAQEGQANSVFLRKKFWQFCGALAEYRGSATTFAAVEIDVNGDCSLCNVGDSRVYHIHSQGQWKQVSHDHTLLAEMIACGEAEEDKDYAAIYSDLAECLIADPEEAHFKVHAAAFGLAVGEAVLLCTDGLSDALSHAALETLWCSRTDLQEKLEALRQAVRKTPMHDDLSIVCMRRVA